MLQLAATTDKLQLVTSAAASIEVHCSYVDHTLSGDNVEGNRQNTAITTAATTDILAAPASGVVRRVKVLTIRNKHASAFCTVTVLFDQNGTDYELYSEWLRPGDELQYVEGKGFFTSVSRSNQSANYSTADETASAADTYITGSAISIVPGRPAQVGTIFRWTFSLTKTAAGTATGIWNVRFGTNGTTADTSRLTFTQTAGTAAADTAFVLIQAVVRGPIGASCIVHGSFMMEHHLTTTGFCNLPSNVIQVTSGAFDITTANIIAGVSCNPGASGAWTFKQAVAEVMNI